MKSVLRIAVATGSMMIAVSVQATIYDAAADFTLSNNPNGVWTYGMETPGFGLLSVTGSNAGLDSWTDPNALYLGVYKNTLGTTFNASTVQLDPYALAQHPGNRGERSVVRFTAPTTGTYWFSIAYKGADFIGPTSTDVSIDLNGSSIFSGLVNGFGPMSATGYSTSVFLNAGDTLDSSVGYGTNGNYYYDTTQVAFKVEGVPEPMSMTALAIGLIGLARRRRK